MLNLSFFLRPASDLECTSGLGLDPGLDPSGWSGFHGERTENRASERSTPSATDGGIAGPTNGIRDAGSGAAGMSGGLPLGGLQRTDRGRTLPS